MLPCRPVKLQKLMFAYQGWAGASALRAYGCVRRLAEAALRRVALKKWCRRRDSNPRPQHYECRALPTELLRHALIRRLEARAGIEPA